MDTWKQWAAQSGVALAVGVAGLIIVFLIVGSMECLPPKGILGLPPPTTLPPPATVATGCYGNDPDFAGMSASTAPWVISGIAAGVAFFIEKAVGAFKGLLDA